MFEVRTLHSCAAPKPEAHARSPRECSPTGSPPEDSSPPRPMSRTCTRHIRYHLIATTNSLLLCQPRFPRRYPRSRDDGPLSRSIPQVWHRHLHRNHLQDRFVLSFHFTWSVLSHIERSWTQISLRVPSSTGARAPRRTLPRRPTPSSSPPVLRPVAFTFRERRRTGRAGSRRALCATVPCPSSATSPSRLSVEATRHVRRACT